MKERPILFSALMVGACLREVDPKTQTRRVVKLPVPDDADEVFFWSGDDLRAAGHRNVAETGCWARRHGREGYLRYLGPCPYGVPGDVLWVKETHAFPNDQGAIYRANWREDAKARGLDNIPADDSNIRWRPSIHMPRRFSRLTLRITDVRVERLQACSEADALAEGIERIRFPEVGEWGWPQRKYRELWDSINGADPAKAWAANPWVWAVSFEKVNTNG